MFQPNGFRYTACTVSAVRREQLREEWQDQVRHFPDYPDTDFDGRGIVMCAGGIRYFTCAWLSIRRLRALGCSLPVEIWYNGNELCATAISELEKYNARCRNFQDHGLADISGFAVKPMAILRSSFREVLFLDADNHCLSDPALLFNIDGYKKTGAVFWPDFWITPADNPIWQIMDVPYTPMKEQESGQLLIDKKRSWHALLLCAYLNRANNEYSKILYGDKDTFRFAWMALKQGFFYILRDPDLCGYADLAGKFHGTTIVQFDDQDQPAFLHRNLLKWDVTGSGERTWQLTKSFRSEKQTKSYHFSFPETAQHLTLDFGGDCETAAAGDLITGMETACLADLEDLRSSDFYAKILLHAHFCASRFRSNNPLPIKF
ncbi:alpha-mannosyltransferase [Chitinophaga rhizosphaerae]|uniref:hypothetical protein n=1 Tax=Chitinophaga rhizosphaerae TaxID=1864947 RepID=UPI000F813D36|nr:hypothetical protein [Chitinophaga rhizosphaerae]